MGGGGGASQEDVSAVWAGAREAAGLMERTAAMLRGRTGVTGGVGRKHGKGVDVGGTLARAIRDEYRQVLEAREAVAGLDGAVGGGARRRGSVRQSWLGRSVSRPSNFAAYRRVQLTHRPILAASGEAGANGRKGRGDGGEEESEEVTLEGRIAYREWVGQIRAAFREVDAEVLAFEEASSEDEDDSGGEIPADVGGARDEVGGQGMYPACAKDEEEKDDDGEGKGACAGAPPAAIEDIVPAHGEEECGDSKERTPSRPKGTPVRASPEMRTPMHTTPMRPTPMSATPMSATLMGATPMSTTPIAQRCSPMQRTPFASTPGSPMDMSTPSLATVAPTPAASRAEWEAIQGGGEEAAHGPVDALLTVCGQAGEAGSLPTLGMFLEEAGVELSRAVKIGEGTYGEAFKYGDRVFKIVPIEGDQLVNGEVQMRAGETIPEVLIGGELSRLRAGLSADASPSAAENATAGFIGMHGAKVCKGKYPAELIAEWERWDAERGSENDPVDVFQDDQHFIAFVFANGGKDLEGYVPQSYAEARSILAQVVASVAAAEGALRFEHRDLHWGNVLVRDRAAGKRSNVEDNVRFRVGGREVLVRSEGVETAIIDYTLSRIERADLNGGEVLYCDLEQDEAIFGGKGDLQFDVYRRMRKLVKKDWSRFEPATNVSWTHYLADKLVSAVVVAEDKENKVRAAANQPSGTTGRKASPAETDGADAAVRDGFKGFARRVLRYKSAADVLTDEFFAGAVRVQG